MNEPAIARYDIRPTPPAVSWDYEGTVAWAKAQVEKYTGLVVTEDQVADIKGIMADINSRKIALDNARKVTRKELLKPVDEWEEQVKSVIRIFDDAYRALSVQVKAFTDAERESRRKAVQDIIDDVQSAYDIQPFTIPIEDRWLNKTTTKKAIREAVTTIVEQRIEQEKARAAQEKARQERVALIEQCVATNNSAYPGINLSVSGFSTSRLMDLSTPAADVAAEIQKAARERHEAISECQIAPAPQKSEPQPMPPVPGEEQKTLTIIITYPASRTEEVRNAAMNLKRLCTSFSVRRRDNP